MEGLFWISISFVLYTYFGYLGLLLVLGPLKSRSVDKGAILPSISLIVCAYNEEKRMVQKIENCLDLDYPPEKLQVVIVSDASTDKTDEMVLSYRNSRIDFLRQESRLGKTQAQNAALEVAKGEILIFSDVSTMLDRDAVRVLVSNFKDGSVGLVSGMDYWYEEGSGQVSGEGQGLYVSYEMMLRKLETKIGSTINASGCFYGVRSDLMTKLEKGVIDDLAVPLMVIRKGLRVIVDSNAIARVPKTLTAEKEFARRTRIIVGGLSSFFKNLDLLNPVRHGCVSIQLISHKLFKWLIPFFLVSGFLSNALLVSRGLFYLIFLSLQVVFYMCAVVGCLRRNEKGIPKMYSVPYFFCSSNLSIVLGWVKYLRGDKLEIWEPSRA